MIIVNIVIGMIFYVNVANAGICQDFEKCRDLLPLDNSTCSSIQTEMVSVMRCISKTGACEDSSAAGVLYGVCLAKIEYYNSIKNCSFANESVACGLADQTTFKLQYKNNQSSPNCSAPSSCDSFANYSACVKSAADNDFTRGKIVGTCLKFRSNATNECNFDETTCGFVAFGSDSNSTNSNATNSNATDTNSNNVTDPTASTNPTDSGASTDSNSDNNSAGTTPAGSKGCHIWASLSSLTLAIVIGIIVTFLNQN